MVNVRDLGIAVVVGVAATVIATRAQSSSTVIGVEQKVTEETDDTAEPTRTRRPSTSETAASRELLGDQGGISEIDDPEIREIVGGSGDIVV